jgi:lysophospholipase L1-like esterase
MPIQAAAMTTASQAALFTAIKTMAAEYNFVIVDATWESGIVRQFEVNGSAGRYLYDGLHPSVAGQQLLSNYISAKINSALNY